MFGVTDLATYTLGALFIILIPGPNSLFVLATAARNGIRTGYRGALGVFVGDTALMVLAAVGVASLIRSAPVAFTVVKYLGAAYLAYLGIRMIVGIWRRSADAAEVVPEARPFRRALGISLMNPKAILFFVSFFSQFVDPHYAHPALSFAVLGVIVQTFSMAYLSVLILAGTHLANQVRRRRRLASVLTGAAGTLFVGFSLKLATTSLT